MIRVLIRLESETERQVSIRAKNIRQALAAAQRAYPDSRARVIFPIDGESFFVKGSAEKPEGEARSTAGHPRESGT
ncbi:hypothetical protein Rxycam_01066 [Rubrobacter xylanophilus DSM 9941]|uniref:hypothetical protein n=1 Tax=Rubrobacter xylanophilus TaxID=49319 RepID=UPI001C63CA49|nr:hypothetical protein [Rubrobacter xylanophilus]QYJ15251.1 hypothetical protein Rxycam_01066 [Rubrobacter xylanophilus DSM 9941]